MPKEINKKRKLTLVLIVCLALFTTGLSCGGGGGSSDTQVTLKFWKPFDSSNDWESIIAGYRKVRPSVRIEYSQKSTEAYERDLLEAMAAGAGPDIFAIRNDWLPRFADKIRPATTEQISPRQFTETFAKVASSDFIRTDKVYALPSSVDVLALYFNRDLLASAGVARAPSTWTELIDVVEKLTVKSGSTVTRSGVALGTSANVNRAADILQLLMLQNGAAFYDSSQGGVTLNTGRTDENNEAPAARAVRFYTQFSDPGSRAYTWNNRLQDSIDAFGQGKVAMIFGYSYLRPTISAKDAFLDYAVAGMPQLSATGTKINLASYWAETVWSGSKNSAQAWDFLRFATTSAQNKEYVKNTGQLSSRLDVLSLQQADEELGVFAENALSARSVPKPEAEGFEKIMTDLIDDVALRSQRPTEAVASATAKLKLLLSRYPLNKPSN